MIYRRVIYLEDHPGYAPSRFTGKMSDEHLEIETEGTDVMLVSRMLESGDRPNWDEFKINTTVMLLNAEEVDTLIVALQEAKKHLKPGS